MVQRVSWPDMQQVGKCIRVAFPISPLICTWGGGNHTQRSNISSHAPASPAHLLELPERSIHSSLEASQTTGVSKHKNNSVQRFRSCSKLPLSLQVICMRVRRSATYLTRKCYWRHSTRWINGIKPERREAHVKYLGGTWTPRGSENASTYTCHSYKKLTRPTALHPEHPTPTLPKLCNAPRYTQSPPPPHPPTWLQPAASFHSVRLMSDTKAHASCEMPALIASVLAGGSTQESVAVPWCCQNSRQGFSSRDGAVLEAAAARV